MFVSFIYSLCVFLEKVTPFSCVFLTKFVSFYLFLVFFFLEKVTPFIYAFSKRIYSLCSFCLEKVTPFIYASMYYEYNVVCIDKNNPLFMHPCIDKNNPLLCILSSFPSSFPLLILVFVLCLKNIFFTQGKVYFWVIL
jgi:hypothetical protein